MATPSLLGLSGSLLTCLPAFHQRHSFLFAQRRQHLGNDTGSQRNVSVAQSEPLALLNDHGPHQTQLQLGILTGHDHLLAGNLHLGGAVPRTREHLQLDEASERLVATAFLLAQDVHLRFEVVVGLDRSRLAHHHSALDVVTFDTAHQGTQLIAGLGLLQNLVEHFDAGDGRFDYLK